MGVCPQCGRTKRVKRIKRKVASEKLTIRQVDGAGEKTEFYPLRMLDEEESSIRGTIRVVQCLLHDILGLTTEVASSALRFVIGDWLTARNLRLMKYIRMMEPESLGADPHLPRGYIENTLRTIK